MRTKQENLLSYIARICSKLFDGRFAHPATAAAREGTAHPPDDWLDDDPTGPPPEIYDPENYRWIPVRRRPRYDGWTPEKQRRFIEVLADTGMVAAAAKAVGMTRVNAYRLRRAEHGAAFARAWDAARHHAGSLIEDVAFERAIEGVEHNVYDEYGNVVCTKRRYNDRLLTFLLTHLKPERYARAALTQPEPVPPPVDAVLRDMEPKLPAPPQEMLGIETMEGELELAEAADGTVPHFLREYPHEKTPEQEKAAATAARTARGKALWDRAQEMQSRGEKLDMNRDEFGDYCFYLDPVSNSQLGNKRFR